MASFTRRECKTLVIIALAHIAAGLCDSLPPPFYPREAESKGATATEYGFVFGIYEFVSFASSPILGKYMDFLGAGFLLRTGLSVAGISMILFGLLHYVDLLAAFIGLSFAVRIIASLGAASLIASSLSIIADVFQTRVATIIAAMEVLYGLGLIIGPPFGALLFNLGGYQTPFLTVGVFVFLIGLLTAFLLPPLDDGDTALKQQPKLCSFLRLTPILLDSYAVAASAMGTGFYAATLEPHIRQFGLTTLQTGAIFAIVGGTYAITAPLVGRLCDKTVSPRKFIVVGAFLGILSFALVGPLPYTGLSPTIWMCCLGLVCQGLCSSCLQVPAFVDGIRSALEYGLPDDMSTYGVISGLWGSSLALGACVGASVAGVLYDNVGFRVGTLFAIGVHLFLMVSMITFICTRRRPVRMLVIEKKTYGTMPEPVLQRNNPQDLGEKRA